jgi:LacI family gluconate utilization system Gnt-I transcriptional repressor
MLRDAQDAGTPVIEMWDWSHETEEARFCQIGFDHEAVGRAMARHLIDRGHRSLAHIDSSVAEDYRAHERGEGFAREARAAGARVKMLRAAAGDVFDAGREMLVTLGQDAKAHVTAAAFANDHLACGALMEAQDRGVQVPAQIAVIGFGDFPLGRQMRPALSTVRPPRVEIGRAVAAALLRSIASGEDVVGEKLQWELIGRESTGQRASASA